MPVRRRRIGDFARRRLGLRPGSLRQRAIPSVVRQALGRAHQHIQTGDLPAALSIYRRLSVEAYQRGRVRAGAIMELESARLQLKLAAYSEAKSSVLHALESLLQAEIVPDLIAPVYHRVIKDLHEVGADDIAEAFEIDFTRLLSEYGLTPGVLKPPVTERDVARTQGMKLPELCPSCSAPVHADAVIWTRPGRTACAYCGRPISAE